MQRALQTPYDVINSTGEKVAEGLLNESNLQLPPGEYTIRQRSKSGAETAATLISRKETIVKLEH